MLEVIKMFAGVFIMGGVAVGIYVAAFILEEVEYRQMERRKRA